MMVDMVKVIYPLGSNTLVAVVQTMNFLSVMYMQNQLLIIIALVHVPVTHIYIMGFVAIVRVVALKVT
jgi:hypothetical protein